ncbi:MAG: sigma-70 family RNA polymerase sigma factor, partial [Bacteroidales bacterium]|nr:sigma-70 family RNA polymerase sigma factor [Bacteroidales bacterium]
MAEDELYRRYAARVLTLCRRYSRDGDEAKDLMQDALIRALDKIQTYKYAGKGSLYGWIRRIAINKAIDQIKRQRWRTVSLDLSSQDNIPEPTEQEMEDIPQEKLLEWIAQLPDMRRTVFNMYCIDGYSHKEIATMLEISEMGWASVLTIAKTQLKERIKQYLKEMERL